MIDKLFLSTIHYKKNDVKDKSGNVLSRTISKEFKDGTEQFYANRLIFDYIALLKDVKSTDNNETRSMNFGDASIDSDTKLLTDIVEDIESSIGQDPLDPYDTYSLWRNTSIRDQFITGKFGIGPFALNNNNHILTMLYGVGFTHNSGSILGITGHESLYDHEDMYGESIMSWLSGLINAHVDVAKDPYISRLNVNKYTYNLVNLMVRTGFGKQTFYFTTQPILKELATRVNNASSAYGSDPNKSKFRRQKDAEDKFITEFANTYNIGGRNNYNNSSEVLDNLPAYLKNIGTSKSALFESIFNKDSELLRQVVKSGKDYTGDISFEVETKNGTVKLSMQELQMVVYAAKVEFDKYAESLSQLVKYCKIDTKKQGKTIAEQRDFMRGYNNLFYNQRSRLRNLFDTESLDRLRRDSYISNKTENATSMFRDILGAQLIEATGSFNDQCEGVLFELPVDDDNISQQLAKKVSDALLVAIRSDFFNAYAKRLGINIRNLVTGDNTIYDRLNKLKIDIQTKEEYEDMRNADGSIDNYLINMLTSGYVHKQSFSEDEKAGTVAKAQQDTYPDAKFLNTMTFLDDDSVDADEVTAAWEELLEDNEHPELQKFARDLIVYSFITTGGNGGSNNIFKYIPTSWLVNPDGAGYDLSYAAYMSLKLKNYQEGAGFKNSTHDDIILNNWTDNQFIPTLMASDVESYYTGRTGIDIINGKQVGPQTDIPIIIQCDNSTANSRFVKINRMHDKESQRSVAIYKKVRTGMKKVDKDITVPVNIYVLTDPKGQNFGGRNKIYEYGRSDATVSEVTRQVKLNRDLVDIAELLGADTSSIESILDKFISFVESKKDKTGALDFLKSNGIKGLLYEAVVENTINKEVENPEITQEMMQRQDFPVAVPFENAEEYVEESTVSETEESTYAVPEKSTESEEKQEEKETINFYSGMITPEENTIFVFGSNPEGRHGAGAAKVAREKFGAIYGQGEGLQGNSYALPTKDLRVKENKGLKSISPEQITENIRKMYEVARQNSDKQFKVAYTNGLNEATLNGYTGSEMIEMFKNAGPIPSNVMFSENWKSGFEQQESTEQEADDSIQSQLKKLGEDLMKQCEQ